LTDHGHALLERRLVVPLEAALDAPEHVRHQHDVALARQPVSQAAHVVVDAEDLLEQQDARAGPVRNGAVRREGPTIDRRHRLGARCCHARSVRLAMPVSSAAGTVPGRQRHR
jgi:hypothetical protein